MFSNWNIVLLMHLQLSSTKKGLYTLDLDLNADIRLISADQFIDVKISRTYDHMFRAVKRVLKWIRRCNYPIYKNPQCSSCEIFEIRTCSFDKPWMFLIFIISWIILHDFNWFRRSSGRGPSLGNLVLSCDTTERSMSMLNVEIANDEEIIYQNFKMLSKRFQEYKKNESS